MTDTCPDCGRPIAQSYAQEASSQWCMSPQGSGCMARTVANLRARVAELEKALDSQTFVLPAPPINTDDERLVDELCAKREAGLRVTPMREVAWIACSERMPADGTAIFFFGGRRTEVFSGDFDAACGGYFNDGSGAWHVSAITHWMPRYVQPKPAPPVTE